MLKFTTEIVNAAILGMEARKEKLDAKIAELRALLPGGHAETAATPEAPTRRRRKFSAAAIKRMREAQQRRWAKVRGENAPAAAVAKPVATKPKRKLSKAGRAAIVAALKKRWAAKKAAAKKAAAKKTA
jgi:leucyl aminopeptidase (aminopeptidase T)